MHHPAGFWNDKKIHAPLSENGHKIVRCSWKSAQKNSSLWAGLVWISDRIYNIFCIYFFALSKHALHNQLKILIAHSSLAEKQQMHSTLPAILKNNEKFYISFTCGSMSRTVLRALAVNWWINPAYWTVVELSIVVLIGMPINNKTCSKMSIQQMN